MQELLEVSKENTYHHGQEVEIPFVGDLTKIFIVRAIYQDGSGYERVFMIPKI